MSTNTALPAQQPQPVSNPVMGLYLDRPSHTIDPRGLEACNNVRIEYGRYRSDLMGWSAYNSVVLNGPVGLIDTFQLSNGPQRLIYGSLTDLYVDVPGSAPLYITPTYSTGTVKVWRYSLGGPVVVHAGGSSGYKVGDVLTATSGTAGLQASVLITAVAIGVMTAGVIINAGYYSTLPANHVTMSGGSGTGTITLDFTTGFSVVVGVGTFWNTPIGGNATALAVAPITGGAGDVNSFELTVAVMPLNAQVGMLVGDASNVAALQVPTTITGINANTLTLSKSIAFQVELDDTIVIGGQLANFRKNARAGDQFNFGTAGQNLTSATWFTVASVQTNTQLTLTADYGSTTTSGNVYTVRQCATNASAAVAPDPAWSPQWCAETFPNAGFPYLKDMWFVTNGTDPLISWDGLATAAQYVTTVPFISAQIHRHKNLMIYGGLIGSNGQYLPSSIANSDNGTPTLVGGGVAFQGTVTDGPFTVNHLGTLGNILMIYMGGPLSGAANAVSTQGGSVISGSFVGFPGIWAFAEVIRGRGPISGNLVAEFPDRHQFLASDGMYRYNGIFVQIMNDHVWRPVLKNFDQSRPWQSFCCINETYGDLQWVIPLQTDVNVGNPDHPSYLVTTAYTEAYMEQPNSYLFKPYTQRDFPFTAVGIWQGETSSTWNQESGTFLAAQTPFNIAGFPRTRPIQLAGDNAGNIWQLYQANGAQGVNSYTSWLWYPQKVLDEHSRVLVTRVYPFIETTPATYTVTVTLALFDGVRMPVAITDTQQFDASYSATSDGTKFRYTKHFRRGRVAQVIIGTLGCTGYEPFIIDGYDLDHIPGGLR